MRRLRRLAIDRLATARLASVPSALERVGRLGDRLAVRAGWPLCAGLRADWVAGRGRAARRVGADRQLRGRARRLGVHRSARPADHPDLDGAAAVGVSGVLFAGALAGDPPLWLLHAANAATWFLAAIHGPARQAAIPRLLADDEVPGRRRRSTRPAGRSSSIVGPALAGLLIGTVGHGGRLRGRRRLLPRRVRSRRSCFAHCPRTPSRSSVAWPRSRRGFAISENHRLLQSTFVIDLVAMIFGSPQALFPVIAAQQLHRGPEAVGLLFAAPARRGAGVDARLRAAHHAAPSGERRRVGRGRLGSRRSPGSVLPGANLIAGAGLPGDRGRRRCRERDLPLDDPAGHGPRPSPGRLGAVFFIVVTGGPKLGDVEAGLVAAAFSAPVSVVTGGWPASSARSITARCTRSCPPTGSATARDRATS